MYIDGKYGILVHDKLLMYQCMNQYAYLLPNIYFVWSNNQLFRINNQITKELADTNEFFKVLKSVKKLIIKPCTMFGGIGVSKIKYSPSDDQIFINNDEVGMDGMLAFLKKLKDEYLITECVEQTGYAHEIFSNTVNTIRLVTLYDQKTNNAWPLGAYHRFGRKNSGVVDNIKGGGICCDIDLKTGMMGACNFNSLEKTFTEHPDSKVKITGKAIPQWEETFKLILELAKFFHKCPLIGWDIAVCSDKIVIIEANNAPDLMIIQYKTPILQSSRNRDFFARYGIT